MNDRSAIGRKATKMLRKDELAHTALPSSAVRRLVLSATQSCRRLGKETGQATTSRLCRETKEMLREDEPSRRCGTSGRLRPCLCQDLRPCLSATTGETGGWLGTPPGQQLTLYLVSMSQVTGKGSRIRISCPRFLSPSTRRDAREAFNTAATGQHLHQLASPEGG